MNEDEKKNIETIKRAQEFFEKASVILGDRSPKHHYSKNRHRWGFGETLLDPHEASKPVYMLHRLDGPAFYTDNTNMMSGTGWYAFSRFHCMNGPAFYNAAGNKEWRIYGIRPVSWEIFGRFTGLSEADIIVHKLITGHINEFNFWIDTTHHPFTLKIIAKILSAY